MIAGAIEKIYATIESPSLQEEMIELCKVITMACFIHPSLYWLPSGLPFLKLGKTIFHKEFPIKKLSGMHAGFLREWQRRLEESNKIRREHSEYFYSALASTLTFHNGACPPFLRLPFTTESREIKERICSFSKKEGLGINHMYPTPINEIEEIQDHFNGRTFPSASKVAERLLTIPTHQLLKKKDRGKICKLFNVGYEAFGNSCLHKEMLQ